MDGRCGKSEARRFGFYPCVEAPARRRREPLRARVVVEPRLQPTENNPSCNNSIPLPGTNSKYFTRERQRVQGLASCPSGLPGFVAMRCWCGETGKRWDPTSPSAKALVGSSPTTSTLANLLTRPRTRPMFEILVGSLRSQFATPRKPGSHSSPAFVYLGLRATLRRGDVSKHP